MNGKNLCVGLIGYGYWGPNLLRNYMELKAADVRWVCDRDPQRLGLAKTRYPSVVVTQDMADVLGDPEVDAVLIATPISTHFELARRALQAGKHVFVEKPMTSSTREARQLLEIANAAGLVLMVGHTFEYSPPVMKIKEIIDSGELGEIFFVTSSRVNLGLHQKDVSVIWDLAPHDFSMLFYWMGEDPSQITAFGRSCLDCGNPDVAFVNIGFPSGAVAEMQLSWLSPVKLRRTMIVGSRKMLLYDDTESVEKVKIYDHGVTRHVEPGSFGEYQLSYRTGDIVSPHLGAQEPLFAEATEFVECVRTGRTPRTDGRSGLRVVGALEQAEGSLLRQSAVAPLEPVVPGVPMREPLYRSLRQDAVLTVGAVPGSVS
jgi:predicted dehydrogenase